MKALLKTFHSLIFSSAILCCCNQVFAQHETGSDLFNGERAFRDYCANCHGPDGDLISQVDLGHNNFRQPYSDEELVNIIMNGIADTPMPATPRVSTEQAQMIVAFLRSLGETDGSLLTGDPARGAQLFAGSGECMDCHMINGKGSVIGPELSSIGLTRSAAELQNSLLDPAGEVQANTRFYTVRTLGGQTVSGRLLNHDRFSVQLLDTSELLRSFQKNDLQSFGFSDPGMPSLAEEFSDQEIADLVAYLASMRRGAAQ